MTIRQMLKVKTVLQIFFVAVVVAMFANTCNSIFSPKQEVIADTVVTHVTHVDTVVFERQVTKTIAKYIAKRDTFYIDTTTNTAHRLNVVDMQICDSLLEGTITTVLDGTIVAQDFKYKPLFPKYIIKVDSIFTTITNTEIKRKNKLYLGINVKSSSNNIDLGPSLTLTTKKDFLIGYNYGVINNSHNVTIGYKLFK